MLQKIRLYLLNPPSIALCMKTQLPSGYINLKWYSVISRGFSFFLQNAFLRDQIVLNYIHLTKKTAIVCCSQKEHSRTISVCCYNLQKYDKAKMVFHKYGPI